MTELSNAPHLRVVIVNFNGGELLTRAVSSVLDAVWPSALDIVIVDNNSTDGSLAAVEKFDEVTTVALSTNDGFSAANNGFSRLPGLVDPDLYFLLNPDAAVESDTLLELAGGLADQDVGVAAPIILFDREFVECRCDRGTVLVGVRVDGHDVASRCLGSLGVDRLPGDPGSLWHFSEAGTLQIPVLPEARCVQLTRHSVDGTIIDEILIDSLEPATQRIQNAGGALDQRWFGTNVDYGASVETVTPPREVQLWCGAAAMFKPQFLVDTGGFDDRYFLYYEDTDLSLVGGRLGWKYAFVPTAVVRHRHSDKTEQGTRLVEVLQHRNRLVMMARHAPFAVFAKSLLRGFATPVSMMIRSGRVNGPVRAGLRRLATWRLAAVVEAVKILPSALRSRRNL